MNDTVSDSQSGIVLWLRGVSECTYTFDCDGKTFFCKHRLVVVVVLIHQIITYINNYASTNKLIAMRQWVEYSSEACTHLFLVQIANGQEWRVLQIRFSK